MLCADHYYLQVFWSMPIDDAASSGGLESKKPWAESRDAFIVKLFQSLGTKFFFLFDSDSKYNPLHLCNNITQGTIQPFRST